MSKWKIDHETDPQPEAARALVKKLEAYNTLHSPTPFQRREVRLLVRDENGQVQAGLLGNVTMHCLAIQILWVDEALRGQGLGAELVRLAEQQAQAADAIQALVETTTFQARGFYEKLGYNVIAEVPDCPIGAVSMIMQKRF
jgi:GNAT superfamily N-acetyltransferase